jgi:hypothetical protein
MINARNIVLSLMSIVIIGCLLSFTILISHKHYFLSVFQLIVAAWFAYGIYKIDDIMDGAE